MKKRLRFYVLVGAVVSTFVISPVCAFADDGYTVSYYDSEEAYFSGINGSYSSSYSDSYSSSYTDYTTDGYYESSDSSLGSDVIYGSSSTPTTRLWSDEPLVNNATANQYRNQQTQKLISIVINGEKYTPRDTQPLLIDGRVFVPLRFVAEQLGYTVSWDSEELVAEINDGAIVVEVGSYTMWKYDSLTIPTDVAPFLYEGTLMVGLRQIGNALNYTVSWDAENRIVYLDRAKSNYDLKAHNVFDRTEY